MFRKNVVMNVYEAYYTSGKTHILYLIHAESETIAKLKAALIAVEQKIELIKLIERKNKYE